MTSILLLSDTHGYIDDAILTHVKSVDEVWHAGDIGNTIVTEAITKYKSLRAVYGNIDNFKIRSIYPEHNRFKCEDVDVWITHIGGYPKRYDKRVKPHITKNPPDLFITGHSHILKVVNDKTLDLLHMNPGAIGKHGFHNKRTMLRFKIDGARIFDLNVIEYPR